MVNFVSTHIELSCLLLLVVISVFLFTQAMVASLMLMPFLRRASATREIFDTRLVLFSSICYITMQIYLSLIGFGLHVDFYQEVLRKFGEILFGIILVRHLNIKRCIYCTHLKMRLRRHHSDC